MGKELTVLILVMKCLASQVYADSPPAVSLGHRRDTVVEPSGRECPGGTLYSNHDGSFENGYAWQSQGVEPPYYGAFGEAYDLGPGCVECGAYWLSELHSWTGESADIYVWDQGVSGEPGAVLALIVGLVFEGMPTWPHIRQFDVPIELRVVQDFTVGFWGNWPEGPDGYFFVCADESEPGGLPWTCISPLLPYYPSGWQHPSIVSGFEGCRSLGLGAYFTPAPSPVEYRSWAAIKALFAE